MLEKCDNMAFGIQGDVVIPMQSFSTPQPNDRDLPPPEWLNL